MDSKSFLSSVLFPRMNHVQFEWAQVVVIISHAPWILSLVALIYFTYQRYRAKAILASSTCNLPTVVWTPRFINYTPPSVTNMILTDVMKPININDQKLSSSNIKNILPRMERLKGPYGMYATVYGISTKVIHMAHPLPIQYILSDEHIPDNFKKTWIQSILHWASHTTLASYSNVQRTSSSKVPAYNHFKNFSGDGVFTADGIVWKEKRSSVIHSLLRGMHDPAHQSMTKLELETNQAAEYFIQTCTTHTDNLLNIVPLLQRSTLGLIYTFITHDVIDRDPDAYPQKALYHSRPYPPSLDTYLQAVNDIRMIILAQSRSIWFLLPRWVYRCFSPMYQQEERTMKPIRALAQYACHQAKPDSPLGMLRQRQSHNPTLDTRIACGKIVCTEMLDEAVTILFAGQDTSAATLSWALHLLSLYPDTLQRLRHEINRVVQSESMITEGYFYETKYVPFTKKMISRMPYLDAVIKETMRLYPAAPFIVRKLQQDVGIPPEVSSISDTQHILPKDSFACIWIYSLHRNPKLWYRPHDFLPERWLDSTLREKDLGQQISGAYIPYAAGARNCLGQPLAHVILRIMLAKIIHYCDIRDPRVEQRGPASEQDLDCNEMSSREDKYDSVYPCRNCSFRQDMQAGFTILPLHGVQVHLGPRP